MRRIGCLLFLLASCSLWIAKPSLCVSLVEASGPPADRSPSVPILLELFTSEGCSSCPPADRWVQHVEATQPVPGAQIIVLSEHVDYWDHDGWRDPNSSAQLTERQTAYERALGLESPYTPQIIVDGVVEARLDQLQKVGQTFQQELAVPKLSVHILGAAVDPAKPSLLQAHVEVDEDLQGRHADIYAAVALNRVESQVKSGENGGKHLVHVAVVQGMNKIGKLEKGRKFDKEIEIKLKPGTEVKNIRLVVFIQEPGPGKVLGTAMQTVAD
jgi:hypothetical protein